MVGRTDRIQLIEYEKYELKIKYKKKQIHTKRGEETLNSMQYVCTFIDLKQ